MENRPAAGRRCWADSGKRKMENRPAAGLQGGHGPKGIGVEKYNLTLQIFFSRFDLYSKFKFKSNTFLNSYKFKYYTKIEI
jgi:hypothetical protein